MLHKDAHEAEVNFLGHLADIFEVIGQHNARQKSDTRTDVIVDRMST